MIKKKQKKASKSSKSSSIPARNYVRIAIMISEPQARDPGLSRSSESPLGKDEVCINRLVQQPSVAYVNVS